MINTVVVLICILVLVIETVLITYGFVCIDRVVDERYPDFDDMEPECRRYVIIG